jgi:hypothetical protein
LSARPSLHRASQAALSGTELARSPTCAIAAEHVIAVSGANIGNTRRSLATTVLGMMSFLLWRGII